MKKSFPFLIIFFMSITAISYFLYSNHDIIKNYIVLNSYQSQKQTHFKEERFTQLNEQQIIIKPAIGPSSSEGSLDDVEINFFGQIVIIPPFPGVTISSPRDPDDCYAKSYRQVSDEFLLSLHSMFEKLGIVDNPFGQMLFLIELFSTFTIAERDGYYTVMEILSQRTSNGLSNAVAILALMHKLGWDAQCFYSEYKCYLGIHFTADWEIKKEIWIVENGKKYHLKELNTHTPAGEVLVFNPEAKYKSVERADGDLQPIPLVTNLPHFGGKSYSKTLRWQYNDAEYSLTIAIPHEQMHFTDNLPKSLFGMIFCGKEELENLGLSTKLRFLTNNMDEYNKVNFLLKFCHSQNIFSYDNRQLIKSISRQLFEGKNDCDGRSVFLYSLLMSVLDYSPSDILIVQWPKHLALALKPKTSAAQRKLSKHGASVGENFYILDPTYTGDTFWGYKMPTLPDEYILIKYNPS
ncbi:MAG: hypothetical protein JSV97_06450 [candidate division WOR-3 bacterium]|nr:MAG: hypothetical protein JSV97_06450 [candidate division WOR-3 bacterium]